MSPSGLPSSSLLSITNKSKKHIAHFFLTHERGPQTRRRKFFEENPKAVTVVAISVSADGDNLSAVTRSVDSVVKDEEHPMRNASSAIVIRRQRTTDGDPWKRCGHGDDLAFAGLAVLGGAIERVIVHRMTRLVRSYRQCLLPSL